jgi:GntR family transcriptional regulator
MELRIETTSRLPIYRQILTQVQEGVARGVLQPGEKLPSVRELSRQLVVNPNTIAKAYTELEREGTLNTRPGLGVFVAVPSVEFTREIREKRLNACVDRFLTEAVHLGFAKEEVLGLLTEKAEQFQWTGLDSDRKEERA